MRDVIKLLKVAELFEKKAQKVEFSGQSIDDMLRKLLSAKFKAAVKKINKPGEYDLRVEWHLVPDKSKKNYDRTKSTATVKINQDAGPLSGLNKVTLGALIKYYEADKLPNPLPDGHPGRREMSKSMVVETITISEED